MIFAIGSHVRRFGKAGDFLTPRFIPASTVDRLPRETGRRRDHGDGGVLAQAREEVIELHPRVRQLSTTKRDLAALRQQQLVPTILMRPAVQECVEPAPQTTYHRARSAPDGSSAPWRYRCS